MSKVTIFKNISETDAPFHRPIGFILDRIKTGSSKELVKSIRDQDSKSTRNELKKNLPAICFSGMFSKRQDKSIIEHSGYICLDFDGYHDVSSLNIDKDKFKADKYVFSVFISPSGDGLKVLVKIPADIDNHVNYFNSLKTYFNSPNFDVTSKNLSRVCYESYDPSIYINDKSLLWDKLEDVTYKEVTLKETITIPITDQSRIIKILMKWWEDKYPMTKGVRNQNAYILARAFNDFGIHRNDAESILGQYVDKDFKENEIMTLIESAYKESHLFGTKFYEDEERINEVKLALRNGVDRSDIVDELVNSGVDRDIASHVVSKKHDEQTEYRFWSKSNKGIVKIVHSMFKQFLQDNGFYKYSPENSKSLFFIRMQNNIVEEVTEKQIKDFTLKYIEDDVKDLSVYDYFADNVRFFKEEFLTMLDTKEIEFARDDRHTSYLFYNNCVVKITKSSIEKVDYINLEDKSGKGLSVWKDQVKNRNFELSKNIDTDFKKFISNVCKREDDRIKSMESTIGYLIHNYKDPSFSPSVILHDESMSENPEGGTGKGIIMKAIGEIRRNVIIDGKSFSFDKSFVFQTLNTDTQVLVFDDVKKHFEFERLFSVITEGITIEKKNRDAIKIPFEESPKIAITTNYAIKGSGNSNKRRRWELELSKYYSKDFTPRDEFGKVLFKEWTVAEWLSFDNYMALCVKMYLENGLVVGSLTNAELRNFIQDVGHDFAEWCGVTNVGYTNSMLMRGLKLKLHDLYINFIMEYPDYAPKSKYSISHFKFRTLMQKYAMFINGDIWDEQSMLGRDAVGNYIII